MNTAIKIENKLSLFYFLLLLCSFIILGPADVMAGPRKSSPRIISLSPSITEIVFKLGQGENLVGVTPYCDFPEKAKEIQKVGGLYDISLEQLLKLKPSIIISPKEHKFLKSASLFKNSKIVSVKQETIQEIKESILLIAAALNKEEKGRSVAKEIDIELLSVFSKKSSTAKKVLVILGGESAERFFYISGKDTLYEEIVDKLGHSNAYKGEIEFPSVSLEGLISMKPDIVINILSGKSPKEIEVVRKKFSNLPGFKKSSKVLKTPKLYFLKEEYLVNPGPRITLIARDFSKILNQVALRSVK